MFKRFFLLALAFMVSLSAFTVFSSVDVNAASPFDSYIQNAEAPFVLKSPNGLVTSSFTDYDQLLNYMGTDSANRINNGNNGYGNTFTVEYYNSLMELINTGAPTLIGDQGSFFTIFVQTNMSATNTNEWFDYGGGAVQNLISSSTPTVAAFNIGIANNGDRYIQGYATDFQYFSLMGNGLLIGSSFPFTVPPDYEGELPNELGSTTKMYPKFGYTIDSDNLLNALNQGIFEEVCIPVGTPTSGCSPPQVKWEIIDSTGDVLNSKTLSMAQPYTYQFPTIGTYYLEATYVLPPPYLAPSVGIELVTARVEMQPNGTFQKGGTGANECSFIDGKYVCEPADPFEDCTTYGLDLIGGFQCVINNFGIWLRNLLIFLFVPNTAVLRNTFEEFGETMQAQFGFIYTSFTMIIQWLNTILTVSPICYVNMGDATFFGAKIHFDFCGFENAAPSIYNPLMTLARLSIAAGFVFIAWRRLKEIVESLGR